jgi:glycosyltransferase involved in cell wall biosynthesis
MKVKVNAKKNLLLIIDNLKKGGAEILLAGILPDLNNNFEVIVVTLSAECNFHEKEIQCKKRYSLGSKNKFSILFSVFKLKKIIKKHQPCLIHSHLFYSSLIARMACPSNIPLIYSVHGEMSKNVFNNSKFFTFLEKKTIKKNHSVITVSDTVLKDYENIIGKHNRAFVLKNYISDVFFSKSLSKNSAGLQSIKLVAVGNIKKAKNYEFLIDAFEHLKGYSISLDIYGHGNEKDFENLENKISKNKLPIYLKNSTDNIHEILRNYDLYVSSSKHEGFGIAAVEAMASGLPLLLSDLPVFHEVTFDNALFFDAIHPISFVHLIKNIFEGKYDLSQLSKNGIETAKQYSKQRYLADLYSIYTQILE